MSKCAMIPRPISLDLTPVEVAARCAHLRGVVFFDTASAAPEPAISIIAALPEETLSGRDWSKLREAVSQRRSGIGESNGLPHGFAAGYVDYEGRFCFGLYEQALIYRHTDRTWHALGDLQSHFRRSTSSEQPRLDFAPEMQREDYMRRVAQAQEYIAAGDIYQVNLAHRFSADFSGHAWPVYESLRECSPAPYGAFLQLDGRAILSASPECFLSMSGRSIRTRPIKGTRPRFPDREADERSADALQASAKEMAELIMITDLERNDLGAICEFGSVHVTELLRLESFQQVFHLVSTIEGKLRPEIDHIEALRRCLPGGSITGAPKKRAMEIIAELEPLSRGVYTGALGWIGFNGESQFNIAIRTMVLEDGRAHFHVGAGIVADSDPGAEWQETLDKAAGLLLAAERLSKSSQPTQRTTCIPS